MQVEKGNHGDKQGNEKGKCYVNDSENLREELVFNQRDPNTRGSSVFHDKFLLD